LSSGQFGKFIHQNIQQKIKDSLELINIQQITIDEEYVFYEIDKLEIINLIECLIITAKFNQLDLFVFHETAQILLVNIQLVFIVVSHCWYVGVSLITANHHFIDFLVRKKTQYRPKKKVKNK
jgi:hypothetical protein